VIERAVIISQGNKLVFGDWLPKNNGVNDAPNSLTLEDAERKYITQILEKTRWQVSGENGAAKVLGINAKTLESRMKKLNIQRQPKNS
jgi:formate hydrogenlyase transcriptional activator